MAPTRITATRTLEIIPVMSSRLLRILRFPPAESLALSMYAFVMSESRYLPSAVIGWVPLSG